MDDIRGSLSRMKKFKHRLTGKKRKPDGTVPNPREDGAGSTSSLPQPESRVVADESNNRKGDRANVAGGRIFPMDQPRQPDGPESVPELGSNNGKEGGKADADGGEGSKRDLYPHPDVGVAVGGGHNGEFEGTRPSPPAPSISHGGKPDSTWIWLFWSMPLIVPSDNADTIPLLGYGPEVVRPDQTVEQSAAADKKKSNYKSAASTTVELLRGVRDSAGAFGLLKSVAGSLCFILDNCEVWPPSRTFDLQFS